MIKMHPTNNQKSVMDVTAPRPQTGNAPSQPPAATPTSIHQAPAGPRESVAPHPTTPAPATVPQVASAPAPEPAPEPLDARSVASVPAEEEAQGVAQPPAPSITQTPLPIGAIITAVFVMIALSALTILVYLQSQ